MDLVRPEEVANAKCPSQKRELYQDLSHSSAQNGVVLAHMGFTSHEAIAASPTRGVHGAEDRLRRAQFDGASLSSCDSSTQFLTARKMANPPKKKKSA